MNNKFLEFLLEIDFINIFIAFYILENLKINILNNRFGRIKLANCQNKPLDSIDFEVEFGSAEPKYENLKNN